MLGTRNYTHPYGWMRAGLLVLLCAALLISTSAQAKLGLDLPEQEGKPVKIVAFGNSITSRRASIDSVFADRLPNVLASYGISSDVINSGVGSSHSGRLEDNDFAKVRHGMDRFDTDVLAHNPDVVIIGFGTNDAYIDGDDPDGPSRISLRQYRANLCEMVRKLKERGAFVILVAPSPFAFPQERMYQDRRLYIYVNMVRHLAKELQVGLSDNYLLFQEYGEKTGSYANLMPDGVHPNDEGHKLIADNIAKEIIRWFNQQPQWN